MVRLKGTEMSNAEKEVAIGILRNRNRVEIVNVNVASYDIDQIYLISNGKSNMYTAFLSPTIDKMSLEEIKAYCSNTGCTCNCH